MRREYTVNVSYHPQAVKMAEGFTISEESMLQRATMQFSKENKTLLSSPSKSNFTN